MHLNERMQLIDYHYFSQYHSRLFQTFGINIFVVVQVLTFVFKNFEGFEEHPEDDLNSSELTSSMTGHS